MLLGGEAELGTVVLLYCCWVESVAGFCDDVDTDVGSVLLCVLTCEKRKDMKNNRVIHHITDLSTVYSIL